MAGLEYQHIGHDPKQGEIAIWSVDDRGSITEDRRTFQERNCDWMNWSHEKMFPELKLSAVGRVELNRRAGTIHISDPSIGLRPSRLIKLLDQLDERYPQTRWYLFGSGFKGEPATAAFTL